MKLYNTLTHNIDEILPINAPQISVYTCGPTVYDFPHVGNWFTYVREDILIRTLKASNLIPIWVMNITDVGHLVSDADEGEDKLEKGARREGKSAWDIAASYTDYFIEGMKRLNISNPDHLPKATDHIAEQIELIRELEEKGFTYIISDGVYFDTSKFPKYAEFAQLDLDEQQAGARVDINPEKKKATDFALWKFSPGDHKRDMEWESPWGKGFPGWHIECSAMSMKYLGETLDIHAGGIDHIPVHHTNEIAQSESATERVFANIWMHSNHITIEGDKISKSLGNGIVLEDIVAKGFSLQAFRLHVLESHYRSQSKFSWDSIEAAQNRLTNYRQISDLLYQPHKDGTVNNIDFSGNEIRILKALQNDLHTPRGLTALSELMATVENQGITEEEASEFEAYLKFIENLFGIELIGADITPEQKKIIAQRDESRKEANWTKSDEMRDDLTKQGIGLRDVSTGAIWYRL